MANPIKESEFIYIGSKRAVVAHVHDIDTIEVVYLDNSGKAIAEDARLVEGKWQFAISGPCGTYANNSSRLQRFVAMLRLNNP